jgi:hypothetical protein
LLAVGGHFYAIGGSASDGIGLWDGSSWTNLDSAPRGINALAEFEGNLIAAGYFTSTPTGVPVNSIARYDGTAWSPFGAGLDGWVYALIVHDGTLIAAGEISAHGSGGGGYKVLEWDGSEWHAVGGGLIGTAYALAEYQGDLVVGGNFNSAGGLPISSVARWDGAAWHSFDTGIQGQSATVRALAVSGRDLYAGGDHFGTASGANVRSVAHWDGSRWNSMGAGMEDSDHNPFCAVTSLLVNAGYIYAGGDFTYADGVFARGIARWNGTWSRLSDPQMAVNPSPTAPPTVRAIAQHGDGVVVAGDFRRVGWLDASNIACWSDAGWSQLGTGLGSQVWSVIEHNGGIVACGTFYSGGSGSSRGLASWDGREWHRPLTPADALVWSVASCQGALVVGGLFSEIGGIGASAVARWDGEHWSPLGAGLEGGIEQTACDFLGTYRGDVIAGGSFATAGGVPAPNIARWDGTQWHAMGTGTPDPYSVKAIVEYDGMLLVAGSFTQMGGVSAPGIAAWDGAAWRSFPSPNVAPISMAVCRGELYVGDDWSPARIHKWNGSTWEATPGLMNDGGVFALTSYHDDLVAAGTLRCQDFPDAGGIARWNGHVWRPLAADRWSMATSVAVAHDELVFGGANLSASGLAARNWARWSDSGIPWVAIQPQAVTTAVGATAVLSAAPATGYPDLQYAWRRNGSPVRDGPAGASIGGGIVAGATASTLTIEGAQPSDAGYYSLDILGPCGGVTSFAAPVSVGSPLCYPNCDQSTTAPLLNVNDFTCFLNAFASSNPYANCDNSTLAPTLNVLDYFCFLNRFAAGCT